MMWKTVSSMSVLKYRLANCRQIITWPINICKNLSFVSFKLVTNVVDNQKLAPFFDVSWHNFGILASSVYAYNIDDNTHTISLAQKEKRTRIHDHKHDPHDDTCGHSCIEDNTGKALYLMLSEVEGQNETCFAEAEDLFF